MAIHLAQRQTAISIVVPAYNELGRLPAQLDRIRTYCHAVFDRRYEVVVVDDGSTDGLGEHLQSVVADWNALSLVRHPANLGKGAAIRTGVLSSTGELVLFTDADGATPIEEEQRLRLAIERGADVAVGSRVDRSGEARSRRRWGRAVPAWAFRHIVRRYLTIPVVDTQCGFKMFRGDVGKRLFFGLQ